MGQCQCKKGALMERNLDTDAGKEDNLVLHDEEIKKQKASKVKSQKKDLYYETSAVSSQKKNFTKNFLKTIINT